MHSAIFTILSVAVTGALAGPFHPWVNSHGIAKRADCTAVDVKFHYNDTTIGVTPSCSGDVMYRGGSSSSSVTRSYAAATTEDACVDGPSTNYTVVSGDTLEKIAAEYNSGVCNIAAANSLTNPDYIVLGETLVVPTNVCEANIDNDSCRTEEGTDTCVDADAGVASTYTIVSGDTFFLIASELGITLDALVAANPDVDASALQVGQVINIPICEA